MPYRANIGLARPPAPRTRSASERTDLPFRRTLYPRLLGIATLLVVEPVLGARFLTIANALPHFWAWPNECRQAWQRSRLQEVVGHAALHVPFYRRLLAGHSDRAGIELIALPVVDKAHLRADMTDFLSVGWKSMPHVRKATSGTTGDPLRYPLDKRAWAHFYGAQLRYWEDAGCRYGEKVVLLGTPPSLVPGAATLRSRLRRRLERRVVSAAGIEIDHGASLRRALLAEREGASLWYGYAGTVAAMADAVLAEGLAVRPPLVIVTTSEPLEPAWRARIEQAFGATVLDEYGCNDGGILAVSCPRGRFHVADNLSLVEVLEGGKPCPPGVEGDVVVTNLHARVLPFLRYKIGDRAALGEGACPCGKPGTTLAWIAGREGDRVRLPGGTEISARAFGPLFWETPNVLRWQVVQMEPTRLRVRLDVAPAYGEAESARILRSLRARCGDELEIDVTTDEPIERTVGGKHRVVVREFA
jgi:phenylacetate-CoA ligase